MKRNKFLMLVLLPDGDIEIRESHQLVQGVWMPGQRVRHRSYNMGDHLEDNLMEEFEAMKKMEEKE